MASVVSFPRAVPVAERKLTAESRVEVPVPPGEYFALEGIVEFDEGKQSPVLIQIHSIENGHEVIATSGVANPTNVEGSDWKYRVELRAPLRPGEYDVVAKGVGIYLHRAKLSVRAK